MALITKLQQETLDFSYRGQPFVQVATAVTDTNSLDISYRGAPFVATSPESGGSTQLAQAELLSEVTVSTVAQTLIDAQCVISSEFSATATISHIQGADLFAFAEAALNVTAIRLRDAQCNIDIAFVLQTDADVIPGGIVQEFECEMIFDISSSVSAQRVASLESEMIFDISSSVSVQRVAGLSIDLVSEFAQTATISHIEGADLFAFAEASLAAAVDRIRDNNVSVSAVFDVGVDAVRIQQSDALVSGAFTVSATALRSKSLESAMNAAFLFSASALRVSRVAIAFDTAVNGEISTAQSRFGAGSVRLKSTFTTPSETAILQTTNGFPNDFGTFNWTLDYWRYQNIAAQSSYINHLIFSPAGINLRLGQRITENGNQFRLQYTASNNLVGTVESVDTISVPTAQWNHFRVTGQPTSSSNTAITVWLNGSRIVTISANSYRAAILLPTPARFFAPGSPTIQTFLDEVRLYSGNLTDKDTLTFTPPSAAFVNDTSTRFLLHLDTDTLDDNLLTVRNPGAVTMSSTVTVSADAQKFSGTSAALSSAATLSANSISVVQAQISMLAMASQLTVSAVNFDLLANLSTTTALSVTARKIVPLQAQVSAVSTVNIIGLRVRRSNIAVNAVSSLAANVTQIKGSLPTTITARATLTASLKGLVQTGRAVLSSQFALACDARVNLNPSGDFQFDPTQRSLQQFVPADLDYTISEIGTQDFVLSFLVDFLPVRFYGNTSEPFADVPRPQEIDRFLRIGNTIILNLEAPGFGNLDWIVEDARSFIENDPPEIIWREVSLNNLTNANFIRITVLRKDGRLYLTLPGSVPTFPAANARDFNGIVYSRNILGTTVSIGDSEFDQFGSLQTNGQWPINVKNFYFEINGEQVSPGTIASADLFTQATLTFEGIIVKFGEADLQSTAQLQATVGKIQVFSAALNSASSMNTAATKVIVASSALSTTATLNCVARKTARTQSSMAVVTSVTVNNTRIRLADSALEVVAVLTVDNSRLRDNTASMASEFTVAAEPLRIKTSAVSFDSMASQLTVAVKTGRTLVTIESQATLSAQAEFTASAVVDLISQAALQLESTVTVQGAADITSEFTVAADVDRVKPMGAELFSAFAANVSAVKRTDIVENFAAQSTFVVAEQRFRGFDSALTSAATVSTQALKARTLQANLRSEFETIASPFNIVQGSADLLSQGFVLTVGRVFSLDPYLTHVIASETRYYYIAPESREFEINQETRILIV